MLDECEVVGREFVVAGCNTPAVFDLVEERRDQIPGSIEMRAEADRSLRLHRGGMLAHALFSTQ